VFAFRRRRLLTPACWNRCVQGCLSNTVSTVPFFVSDNDGMSSSLRAFNDHRCTLENI
jgi:hypothetical protein